MTVKQKQNLRQYLGYYDGIPDNIWGERFAPFWRNTVWRCNPWKSQN